MTGWQITALGLAALLLFWALGAYKRLMALRSAVAQAWQLADEALRRRGGAVAPLVGELRGLLVNEGAALDALLSAQAQVQAAADAVRARPLLAAVTEALVKAEAAMSSSLSRVLALLDLHPELKDVEAVATELQVLGEAAPRLDFARQLFNDAAQAYDAASAQFPTRLLSRLFGLSPAGRI